MATTDMMVFTTTKVIHGDGAEAEVGMCSIKHGTAAGSGIDVVVAHCAVIWRYCMLSMWAKRRSRSMLWDQVVLFRFGTAMPNCHVVAL